MSSSACLFINCYCRWSTDGNRCQPLSGKTLARVRDGREGGGRGGREGREEERGVRGV